MANLQERHESSSLGLGKSSYNVLYHSTLYTNQDDEGFDFLLSRTPKTVYSRLSVLQYLQPCCYLWFPGFAEFSSKGFDIKLQPGNSSWPSSGRLLVSSRASIHLPAHHFSPSLSCSPVAAATNRSPQTFTHSLLLRPRKGRRQVSQWIGC